MRTNLRTIDHLEPEEALNNLQELIGIKNEILRLLELLDENNTYETTDKVYNRACLISQIRNQVDVNSNYSNNAHVFLIAESCIEDLQEDLDL